MLSDLAGGNREIVDVLLPIVYDELSSIAHRHLRGERANHTLDTSALVHEAYLKLIKNESIAWQSRAHFLAMAAIAMRRILIGYARKRQTDKRGGDWDRVTFEEDDHVREVSPAELIDLDDALDKLAAFDERQAQVVTYKFFGGLTHEEIAEVLGVAPITIHREWKIARLWLSREMRADEPRS